MTVVLAPNFLADLLPQRVESTRQVISKLLDQERVPKQRQIRLMSHLELSVTPWGMLLRISTRPWSRLW
jgi:hypothetical protein